MKKKDKETQAPVELVPAENGPNFEQKRKTVCIFKSVTYILLALMFLLTLVLPTLHYTLSSKNAKELNLKDPDAYSYTYSMASFLMGNILESSRRGAEEESFNQNKGELVLQDTLHSFGAIKEATQEQVEKDVAFKRSRSLTALEKMHYVEHFIYIYEQNNESIARWKYTTAEEGYETAVQANLALLNSFIMQERDLMLDTYKEDIEAGNYAGLRFFVREVFGHISEGNSVDDAWFNEAKGKFLIGDYDKAAVDAFVSDSVTVMQESKAISGDKDLTNAVSASDRADDFESTFWLMPRYEQVFSQKEHSFDGAKYLTLQKDEGVYAMTVIRLVLDAFLLLFLIVGAVGLSKAWHGKKMKTSAYSFLIFFITLLSCIAHVTSQSGEIFATTFSPASLLFLFIGLGIIVVEAIYNRKRKKLYLPIPAEEASVPAEGSEETENDTTND